MTKAATPPIATALGRIPSGLFIVTTRLEKEPIGFLGSLVQQVGFEPPIVCVAFAKDRPHFEWCLAEGRFGLSILDESSQSLKRAFLKRRADGESAFDGLNVGEARSGTPILLDALAWLDCRITGRHDTGDHAVLFAEVVEAGVQRAGDPYVHLRKNGLSY